MTKIKPFKLIIPVMIEKDYLSNKHFVLVEDSLAQIYFVEEDRAKRQEVLNCVKSLLASGQVVKSTMIEEELKLNFSDENEIFKTLNTLKKAGFITTKKFGLEGKGWVLTEYGESVAM